MNKNHVPSPGPGQPVKDGAVADHWIQLRVTRGRKSAYVRAARPGKLSEFMFRACDQAAGYSPAAPPGK